MFLFNVNEKNDLFIVVFFRKRFLKKKFFLSNIVLMKFFIGDGDFFVKVLFRFIFLSKLKIYYFMGGGLSFLL